MVGGALSRIAMSVLVVLSAAKISAMDEVASEAPATTKTATGRAKITCARAAENLGGRAAITEAMLVLLLARSLTTLLALSVMTGG